MTYWKGQVGRCQHFGREPCSCGVGFTAWVRDLGSPAEFEEGGGTKWDGRSSRRAGRRETGGGLPKGNQAPEVPGSGAFLDGVGEGHTTAGPSCVWWPGHVSMFRRQLLGCLNAVWRFHRAFWTETGVSNGTPWFLPCWNSEVYRVGSSGTSGFQATVHGAGYLQRCVHNRRWCVRLHCAEPGWQPGCAGMSERAASRAATRASGGDNWALWRDWALFGSLVTCWGYRWWVTSAWKRILQPNG